MIGKFNVRRVIETYIALFKKSKNIFKLSKAILANNYLGWGVERFSSQFLRSPPRTFLGWSKDARTNVKNNVSTIDFNKRGYVTDVIRYEEYFISFFMDFPLSNNY